MSKCMTFADETIDEKETCIEVTAKDIVDIILEEVLRSVTVVSHKSCNRIGDFNVIEDFCQQFDDQHPNFIIKELDKNTSNEGTEIKENQDGSLGLLSAKENIEQILDTLVKQEEKVKAIGEFKVISGEVLADNELQIQNGQIRLEKNEPEGLTKNYLDPARFDFYEKKDVVKDEKIEIEYFNEGKINKIYVPLSDATCKNSAPVDSANDGSNEGIQSGRSKETKDDDKLSDRPFTPITTEELQKVWGKANSSAIGGWDGDVSAQPEDVIRLMEGLSSVQVFPEASSDPNRPRACAFAEEDVKKIIKEIEEISFNQSIQNTEEGDLTYHPDGQGDADLESKSSIKSNEVQKPQREKKEPPGMESEEGSDSNKSFLNNNDLRSQAEETIKNKISAEGDDRTKSPNSGFEKGTPEGQKTEPINGETDNSKNENPIPKGLEYEENLVSSQMYLSPKGVVIDSNERVNLNNVSPSASYVMSKTKVFTTANNDSNENFITESGHLIKVEIPKDCSPGSMSFTETNHRNINKELETHYKDFKLTTENDDNMCTEKRPESIRSCRSVNDASQESLTCESHQTHGSSSLGRLKAGEGEPYDSFISGFSLAEAKGTGLLYFDSDLDHKSVNTMEGFPKVEKAEAISNTNLSSSEKETPTEAKEPVQKVNDLNVQEGNENEDKILGDQEEADNWTGEASTSSTEEENKEKDETTDPENYPPKFKLSSPKMYPKSSLNPVNHGTNKLILTDSEEAIIDSTERVLQVIEPPESSTDEISEKISLSLLKESNAIMLRKKAYDKDCENDLLMEWNVDKETGENENGVTRRVYSGMTTIGPMKNLDYDPKNLTSPDIDYGKMTRITSSRVLANEIFAGDLTVVPSVKIITEEDSDEDETSAGEDQAEGTTLLNRDIASLTKVQKVREVMSHQPKLEEDFDDEESLGRTRLDLKDVESMTDERYKVPEVSIPLLSFEVGNNAEEAEKEFIQNINLVLTGNCFPEVDYFEEEIKESTPPKCEPVPIKPEVSNRKPREEKSILKVQGVQLPKKDLLGEKKSDEKQEETLENKKSVDETPKVINSDSDSVSVTRQKCATLGGVLKKASSKLIRKDGDLSLRSSRSLPRDSRKLAANDSIKSLLDDCHSSATNVLKKSRSFLKNTQSIFKTISQNRFQSQDSAAKLDNQKPSPSESEIGNLEKKLSSFFRKEDFTNAKNLIKSKMEKTFKLDSRSSPRSSPEICPETTDPQDLGMAVRNSDGNQADRSENIRKLLPKTPLVYKSQFVKSQISVSNDSCLKFEETGQKHEDHGEGNSSSSLSKTSKDIYLKEEGTMASVDSEIEIKTSFEDFKNEGKLIWVGERQEIHETQTTLHCETQETGYIVMKTVQGLPTIDFESASEPETSQTQLAQKYKDEGRNDVQEPSPYNIQTIQIETPNYLKQQHAHTPSPPPNSPAEKAEDKEVSVTPAGKKPKTKTKKFSARFRSFWTSAFGKVKTPTKKSESS